MTLESQYRPLVLDSSSVSDSEILRGYAEFWKIPWQTKLEPNVEHTVFSTGYVAPTSSAAIVLSPSGREGAKKIAKDHKLTMNSRKTSITIPFAPGIQVSLRTEFQEFSGANLEPVLRSGDISILSKIRGTKIHLLAVDLVGDYARRVSGGFEDKPSWRFWLATKLPFSYQSIPRFLRDRLFRSAEGATEITEDRLGPVECLRTIFLASVVLSSGPVPRIAFWKRGKSYALAVSHDVESRAGLETGAPRLIAVERNLGIRSTWNVPSARYPLPPGSLDILAETGEVGAHDTVHDGRLIFLSSEEMVRRLKDCKQGLEKLTGRETRGFRSPLLQHSADLASAIGEAGYQYDSSCPSWEILSPTSMRPHGAGTVFPFEVGGVLEIPVSLPQDHQLIRVAGQDPATSVDLVLRVSRWIRGLGGPCILLVHPDYELGMADWTSEYRRLLEHFVSDQNCHVMTLGEMADWWRHRSQARWDTTDGKSRIVSLESEGKTMKLEGELVTGYGSDGFTFEPLPSQNLSWS